MKPFYAFIRQCVVSLVLLSGSVSQAKFETDEKKLIQLFKDLHSDHKLFWPEIGRQSLETPVLNRICNNVVDQLRNMEINETTYVTVERGELQDKRVIREASVHFGDGLEKMPLLKCVYKEKTLYLADGDRTKVFLMKDNGDGTFSFDSGADPDGHFAGEAKEYISLLKRVDVREVGYQKRKRNNTMGRI